MRLLDGQTALKGDIALAVIFFRKIGGKFRRIFGFYAKNVRDVCATKSEPRIVSAGAKTASDDGVALY